MTPHFMFPCSPFDSRMIDEPFQDQAIALKQAGFGTSCFSLEDNRITGMVPEGVTIVYRGWMMTEAEYAFFYGWLRGKNLTPLTTIPQYATTHYLPNWYAIVEDRWGVGNLTPRTEIITGDELAGRAEAIVAAYKWPKFQVKDFVKSLKTAGGSVHTDPKQIKTIMEEMEKYRGVIEGGLCLREWEDYYPNSEKRYFILDGKFYGQDVSFDVRAMEILQRLARDIPSPFFSADIAERIDGRFRVVELGDGQVSDLVGWTDQRFTEIWK